MKIVINSCYGGFSLSALAVKRMAELNGKECYFFKFELSSRSPLVYKPISINETGKSMMWVAFSVKNPLEFLPKNEIGKDGTYKDFNAAYDKIKLDNSPDDRSNPILVKTVEELGESANGLCAGLKVIEIPDGIEWEIDEYDGMESVHEKHQSWS
jgi:hypothetical protein